MRLFDTGGSGSELRQATEAELRKGELAIRGEADQSVVVLGSRAVLLTWVGTVCERGYSLLLRGGVVVVTPDARPGCDTGRVTYSCLLSTTFDLADGFVLQLRRPVLIDG